MKKNTTTKPLVSVVVLNWNRPHDTIECVASLKRQTYTNNEIIVVDNGSVDNSLKLLTDVKGITLVKNPTNRGFTGGHIDGLKHAHGDFIFVLNNDAVVDKEYIKNALEILQKDSTIAVVGGRSYQWESKDQIYSTKGPFYGFQNINRFSMEGIFTTTDAGYDHEVNWVSGSAMVIRKEALDKAGYFYDPMFAYYEESDLFARIQANNYTIVYSPSLKIWHKNGASSSSYFQFYQLFKNRFIYSMRNLAPKDFSRFLKSYIKITIRGSYHHLTRHSNNDDEKVMNKALYRALRYTISTWPRWALSRKTVLKRDARGYNLTDRLKIEQTGISFVCDISNDISSLENISSLIKEVSYRHYNSEVIIVCNKSDEIKLVKLLTTLSLSDLNVRIAANTKLSSTNPLNIGWLSASKDIVWFIEVHTQPTIEMINHACLNLKDDIFSFYSNDHSLVTQLDLKNGACMSRSLLTLGGGIAHNNLARSLFRLAYLAQQLQIKGLGSTTTKIDRSSVSDTVKKGVKRIIHAYLDHKKVSTRYARILSRYYRLYQLHNLSRWLFIGELSPRHKAARIRNSLIAISRLNRRALALELKHISNEVVKTRHSGFDLEEHTREITKKNSDSLIRDNWKSTPIFIICRDRVTPLKQLVMWLESTGMKNIVFIDNASIYPPLLEYFNKTPYQVIKTGKNVGHTVVWSEGFAKTLFPGSFYIVTDPDVIPDVKAPKDSVRFFYQVHKKFLHYQKVGFGLQIDDLPNHYKLKSHVMEWEKQFWTNELNDGVYEAGIDTTFALYKPYTDYYTLNPSIRTGRPYTAMHLPWYVDSSKIDEEEAFYRLHANQDITSWNTNEILERYERELRKNK